MMNVMGTIPKMTNLPTAFELLGNAIGGNVGFLPVQDDTINGEVRDLIKSILRGVYDFRLFDESDWYPDPKQPVGGQNFNVYNLDPFVWFVHRVLNLSGYGFSLDDDVADVEANYATTLAFSISGLGVGGVNPLKNTDEWANGAPFGTVSDQATISIVNTDEGEQYWIQLADKTIYWQIYPPSDVGPGALVSGRGHSAGDEDPGLRASRRTGVPSWIQNLSRPARSLSRSLASRWLSSPARRPVSAASRAPSLPPPTSFHPSTRQRSSPTPSIGGTAAGRPSRLRRRSCCDHVFVAAGTYTVRMTARDQDGNVGQQVSSTVNIVNAEAQPDPVDPTRSAFVVGGSARRDAIHVRAALAEP